MAYCALTVRLSLLSASLLSKVDVFIEIINILFNTRLKKVMDHMCSSDEVYGTALSYQQLMTQHCEFTIP